MADPKKIRQRIDDRIHMLSSSSAGERRMAFADAERLMQEAGCTWRDVGLVDSDKYTEAEVQEYAQIKRAEGVEAGIKIGEVRAAGGRNGNGQLVLPKPAEMAEYCHDRLRQLQNDWQRDFIGDIYVIARRGSYLSPKRLGNLANIYIQLGGKT